jgi:choline dehydrogenase-like flavoprotein
MPWSGRAIIHSRYRSGSCLMKRTASCSAPAFAPVAMLLTAIHVLSTARRMRKVIYVEPALKQANVTILTNACVERLETEPTGRRVSAVCVDDQGAKEAHSAEIVLLSCGAINSALLLLRCACDRQPRGLANSSGVVGRHCRRHNNTALMAMSRRLNPTKCQKTLALNDLYLNAPDFPYPLGHIQMLDKSHGATIAAEAGSSAGTIPVPHPLKGSERQPWPGARTVGKADPAERLEVTVLLRRWNAAALAERVKKLARRESAGNHLSRDQFENQFGADPTDIANVRKFAGTHGLAVVQEHAGRRTVVLSGTVAQFNAALGVDLRQFEYEGGSYRGRVGAVQLPDGLHDVVEAVLGLDNRPAAKPHFRIRPLPGEVRGQANGGGATSFTPLQLASLTTSLLEPVRVSAWPSLSSAAVSGRRI